MATIFGRHEAFTPWRQLPVDFVSNLRHLSPDIKDSEVLTALAVFLVHPDEFPTTAKLAAIIGVHPKTVSRSMVSLRRRGIVGGQRTNKLGVGAIQEANLEPFWDKFAAIRADRGSKSTKGSEPLNNFFGGKAGSQIAAQAPPDAKVDDFRAVRHVLASGQSIGDTWQELEAMESRELAVLAGHEQLVDRALRNFPLMGSEAMETLGPAAAMPITGLAATEVPDGNDLERVILKVTDMPPSKERAEILSFDDLSEISRQALLENTLAQSIPICYPLWGDRDFYENYLAIIDKAYAIPATSHDEVWSRIIDALREELRQASKARGHRWKEENSRLDRAFASYLEDCDGRQLEPLRIEAFRERFYRYRDFQEYVDASL